MSQNHLRLAKLNKRKRGILRKAIELSDICEQEIVICMYDRISGTFVRYQSHPETDLKAMEKLAALKEKHYLNQMGRQIQAKFGLSSDRSLKIAKVAHQFNQLSGSRELTEKDAELFAVGVMGASMKDVEVAMKKSMKGESELFDKLLNDIASHNGTTPEKVNGIISQIFF